MKETPAHIGRTGGLGVLAAGGLVALVLLAVALSPFWLGGSPYDGPIISVPTAFAVAPKELIFLPRRIAQERTNLYRWTLLPRGGHFSGAENPAALVDEYRALASAL